MKKILLTLCFLALLITQFAFACGCDSCCYCTGGGCNPILNFFNFWGLAYDPCITCNCTDPDCGWNPCLNCRRCCDAFGNIGAGDFDPPCDCM